MLTGRPAAEILGCEKNAGARVAGLIECEFGIELTIFAAAPVIKNKLAKAGLLDALQKLLGNDLIGIDVRAGRAGQRGLYVHERACIGSPSATAEGSVKAPVADIGEVAGDRRRRCHHWANQVSAAAAPLAAFKVAVAGGGATFARIQDVRIHPQTHGAA